ncbi:hypothetical protein BC939DRAFT_446598 [Gamsiella multidivaricata]|uniref:uncharacterized protein n=1 Tax=Gamsiella multidivaricata TaxID=101098 RepID=UPI002220F2BD|nr:uncharacterized protein BC939DRAFT_446598 [Gamsiella multidivaricata]KAI7826513.1 hypothetical protein BC939DRAFT_446598 [Gamsiella multidivaricata]
MTDLSPTSVSSCAILRCLPYRIWHNSFSIMPHLFLFLLFVYPTSAYSISCGRSSVCCSLLPSNLQTPIHIHAFLQQRSANITAPSCLLSLFLHCSYLLSGLIEHYSHSIWSLKRGIMLSIIQEAALDMNHVPPCYEATIVVSVKLGLSDINHGTLHCYGQRSRF